MAARGFGRSVGRAPLLLTHTDLSLCVYAEEAAINDQKSKEEADEALDALAACFRLFARSSLSE